MKVPEFFRTLLLGYLVALPFLLLPKYLARAENGLNGVASASIVGLIAGLTLPSPYRELAYGAGFTSCSTNESFTIEWEALIAFVFVLTNLLFRPILNGIGGKLGMTVYLGGHISACILIICGEATFESTTLHPGQALSEWVDLWFHSYGSTAASVFVMLGLIVACGLAASLTLFFHLYFDKCSNPVVASSLVSIVGAVYLPWHTALPYFIWTGAFVGMSGGAASPTAYSLVKISRSKLWSDLVSIFMTGIWGGVILVGLWWMAPGIGGKYGFIAFVACYSVHLLTMLIQWMTPKKACPCLTLVDLESADNTPTTVESSG